MANKDFRASQVRVNKIIASGSASGAPALLTYSASSATDYEGNFQTNMLANVGTDAVLFVSGTKGGHDSKIAGSVAVFVRRSGPRHHDPGPSTT